MSTHFGVETNYDDHLDGDDDGLGCARGLINCVAFVVGLALIIVVAVQLWPRSIPAALSGMFLVAFAGLIGGLVIAAAREARRVRR